MLFACYDSSPVLVWCGRALQSAIYFAMNLLTSTLRVNLLTLTDASVCVMVKCGKIQADVSVASR